MPYVLSKLSNSQVYTKYAEGQTDTNLNVVVAEVKIDGGADVINKQLVTPQGVVTKVSDNELEILKSNKDFQRHLENGLVKYYNTAPKIEKEADKMEKDKSKQLTAEDYKKAGKKAPKVANE